MTPGTVANMPNTPGTPRRTIRIPGDLWEAAATIAEARGETLTAVINAALRRYVQRHR